ncbi:alkaline phosphatase D family protein [Allomuricauda sp. d1]|uniref:alkaline phosphatase D family protein n=1 Tax=Allomuricauda sp. d1 TaxID=3136725 RepID=UPI0031D6449D
MRYIFLSIVLASMIMGCGPKPVGSSSGQSVQVNQATDSKVVVTFGSCNKHDKKNVFWDDISDLNPDVFIWGGDIIYADTDDMAKMRAMYAEQNAVDGYAQLKEATFITGTWDDHDYGLNDGGEEFEVKQESQQVFLDFMDVPSDSPRRTQEGVYTSHLISKPEGAVKLILLDTRYFRSQLEKSQKKGVRYELNTNPESTVLGDEQWQWLERELGQSSADFNLIVTSIQFLSNEHGFEKWANFPHEVERMKVLLAKSGAKGIVFLSGDRHISEFSRTTIEGVPYPIVDFTSSGLTHSYSDYSGEPNPYRVGEVVSTTSFGYLEMDLLKREVIFKMLGDEGELLNELKQAY